MALNFDNVDATDFGYIFNDGLDVATLEQAKRQLEAASDRAALDVQMRQVVLSQAGRGYFGSDDTWQRLTAKAGRLDDLRYAVVQKIHMEKAKAEARDESGPRLYQVTQTECQLKKEAYGRAVADVTMAKKNALDFGPDLPDVREHVDYLAKQAAVGRAEYQLAAKKLAYNEKRQTVVAAYDNMMAAAKKLCMARTEGELPCLGLLLKLERESFEPLAPVYNAAAKDVNEAINHLATVRGPTSGPTASPSTTPSTSAIAASSSTAPVVATSAAAYAHGDNNQLEDVPRFRSTDLPAADLRQSTSSTRRDFEALLASVYGGLQAPASVMQSASATRLTTTTRTTMQRLGPWTVTETSIVYEQIQADRLFQLTASWELIFGSDRAVCQQMSLDECIESGDQDGWHRPPRVPCPAGSYPTVTWVKRGHSDRRGPREDRAWIKFRTLDEARDCKWRHRGLTAWDDYNDQPRPLHLSFSTHPAYKGLKQ